MMASIRKAQNIDQLFPMQREIIGVIEGKLSSRSKHGRGDLCICAPTGSGKTLSYVVPIVSFFERQVGSPVEGFGFVAHEGSCSAGI
mmetsp:Transcript_12844/g.17351  ORF Transcript_12844/g.17351 Transcript_12844/m.17351 type:complete len:87 (-) Transcript_12844:577-837(-)